MTLPMFGGWHGDPDKDGRVTTLAQAMDAFDERELCLVLASAIAVAHRDMRLQRASYAMDGFVVTVERINVA